MKTSTIKAVLAAALLTAIAGPALAEDIDIFSGPAANGSVPNILFVVDSRASNDAQVSPYTCSYAPLSGVTQPQMLTMLQCALYMAIGGITNDPVLAGQLRVAIMVAAQNKGTGGRWYMPAGAPYDFTLMNAAGVAAVTSVLQSTDIKTPGNGGLGDEMWEAWAFFTGHTGPSGISYSSHIGGTLSCQRSYIIMIGNVDSKHDNPSNSGGGQVSDLTNATPTATQLTQINSSNLGPYTGEDPSSIDEWARYLHQTDFNNNADDSQSITTYTIGTYGDATWPDKSQALQSTANQGGGKAFFANNLNDLVADITRIFYEVAATNSVFASASLPISTNTQGSFQNQVFIGMFRPDAGDDPRWMGNLKQYQFGTLGAPPNIQLFLADSNGADAISASGSGFISPTAVSFWTTKTSQLPDSIGGFWLNNPQGAGGGYDSPDGEIVEKGGVGQQIRLANLQDNYVSTPASPRNVYTCWGGAGTLCASNALLSATPFATTNNAITTAALGITGATSTVSSISRNGTTVTMTLSAAPATPLTNGQSVTVQGAANAQLNGTFAITLVNSTTFTYTITESPPSPATGSYTASLPSNPKTITGLARAGTLVTATSNGHGYANGESITISGANGSRYNGTFVISGVTANTFQYTIIDSPTAATTGGNADIGATHTSGITFTAAQITRDATHSDNTSIVTVTSSSNLAAAYAAGAKVNVTNVTPTGYNVSLATITAIGNSCPSGSNKKSFCYSITTTPASPDIGGSPKADRTSTVAVSGLTHAAACTGSSPTATATVTATTSAADGFVTGDVVSIAGNPVGASEGAYVGSFSVTAVNSTTFTYAITTTPPCAPSAAGVTVVTAPSPVACTDFSNPRDCLINWVRGDDNIGDEPSPGNGITVRGTVHGDVIHSRPAVVDYGGTTGVVVFYGANDGTFRAINGNQTASIGTVPPGGELWSFIPQEFFSKLQRLFLNSPMVKLLGTPTSFTPTPQPKDYFFDGTTAAYQDTAANKTYVFLSARRGGRLLYALDVTTPAQPRFMWKKGCPSLTSNTGCDAGFSELGQTWSQPKAAKVQGYSNPVLIFGAGYDANEDTEPPGTDTMGRGIFILDALNGSIVWQAQGGGAANTCSGTPCQLLDMTYAVAADVTLLDRMFPNGTPPDGFVNRLYAADTGGNLWRVDLNPTGGNTPSNWQVTKFAALGGSGATKRKFLFPPDVVSTTNFDAIMAVTGDREHPVYANSATSIVNRFYMIKDTLIGYDGSSWTPVADNTSSTADTAPASLVQIVLPIPPNPKYDLSLSGFYVTLPNAGEKGVNAPTTIGGFTYFGTNQPTAPSNLTCNNGLGTARDYQVNLITGETASITLDTGGLPPSPVAGLVDIDNNGTTLTVPFLLGGNPSSGCTGPDCKSSLGGTRPPIPISPTRRRLYWYQEKLDK